MAAHLHGLGILHGDLYAHNILQDGQGGALLGDFGAASCYGPASPLGPALERLEVRAFGCLLEELIELGDVTAELRQALETLMHDCLGSVPATRPDFAQVQARLMGLSG